MKKKLVISVLILVGVLVLAGPARADDPKAAASQTKEPVASAAPAVAPKAPEAQTKTPTTTATKTYDGKIVDARTKAPIAGALVTLGDQQVRADQDGVFHLEGAGETLKLRYPGYARREIATSELGASPAEIALTPFMVKALYLSSYGFASKKIREAAKEAIKLNNMNALVIDIKGDRGFVCFKVNIPLAEEVGAQKTILFKDMKAVVDSLKEQGLYLIARIVVFKDDPLAAARPQWAVKTKGGGMFRDREKLRWIDPFRQEAWDYNIAIAKAAADVGFDEVQFDYVRFPDNRRVGFSKPTNQDSRTEAITGFLKAAHRALAPYNVMVAADIFGYVMWNLDDTGIGQKVAESLDAVDVVCPMLYPSGYQFGIPKYKNPVQNTYEIVYLSLKRAQERTGANPLRFRPWLQAFRDYAFRGGDFSEERMRVQIQASDKFGAS
ncbi:MAG: putative glycoside hydrolase, partial [Pseudomonadota bacterium]